jgi:hypothetical protein
MEINGPTGTVQIAVVLLIGVAAIGYGAYSYTAQTSALDSAVEVEATITSTSVDESSARRGVDYVPQATFEYSYEGSDYTSSNVYPGPLSKDFDTEEAAREELSGYEPGDTVTAYVPPDSPGNAYLQREGNDKPLFLIGFGALFVLFGGRAVVRGDF